MRKPNALVILAMVALLGNAAAAYDAMPWASSLATAQQIAVQQNKLILLHFWGPDCVHCVRLEQTVFSQPTVGRLVGADFVPVKVNARQSMDLARQFDVRALPTDVVITPAGQVVSRLNCPQDPGQYVSQLQRVAGANRMIASGPRQPSEGPADERFGGRAAPAAGYGGGYAAGPYGAPPTIQNAADPRWNHPAPDDRGYGQPGTMSGGYAPPAVTRGYEVGSPYAMSAPPAGERSIYGQADAPTYDPYRGGTGPRGASPPADRFTPPPADPSRGYDRGGPPADRWEGGYGASPPPSGYGTGPREPSADRFAAGQPPLGPQGATHHSAYGTRPTMPPSASPQEDFPLCLDGYCPVSLVRDSKLRRGDERFGARHRGRTYLFASQAEQQAFLADPDRYGAVLSGKDPVLFAENGALVDGYRQHGVTYNDKIYLFSSEETLERFWRSPQTYAAVANRAMREAARR